MRKIKAAESGSNRFHHCGGAGWWGIGIVVWVGVELFQNAQKKGQKCPHKSAAVHLFQSRVVMSDGRRCFLWRKRIIKRKNCNRTGDLNDGRKRELRWSRAWVSFSDLISIKSLKKHYLKYLQLRGFLSSKYKTIMATPPLSIIEEGW